MSGSTKNSSETLSEASSTTESRSETVIAEPKTPKTNKSEPTTAQPKKGKTSWVKRIVKFILFFLLLLFVLLAVAYLVRIPLLNFSLKQSLPDGIQVSIGTLDIAGIDRNIHVGDVDVTLRKPAFEGELDVTLDQIDLLGIDYAALTSEAAQKLKQEGENEEPLTAKQLAQIVEEKIKGLLAALKTSDETKEGDADKSDAVSETDHNVLADTFQIEGIAVAMKTDEMSLNSKLSTLIINGIDYTYSHNHDVVLGSFQLKETDVTMKNKDMDLDVDLTGINLNKLDYTYLTSTKDPMKQHDAKLSGIKLSKLKVKLNQDNTKLDTQFDQLNLKGIQFKNAVAQLKQLGLDVLNVNLSQPDVPVNNIDLKALKVAKVKVGVEKGDVSLASLALNQVDAKLDAWQWVAGLTSLELNQLALKNWSENITLAKTRLNALALDIKKKEAVRLPELAVNDVSFNDQNLLIDQVHLLSPQINVVREKSGAISLAPPVSENDSEKEKDSKSNEAEKEQGSKDEQSKPLEYVINRILIDNTAKKSTKGKQKKGYVRWVDKAVGSPVDLTLSIDELKVTDLDSQSHKAPRTIKHKVKQPGKKGDEVREITGKTHVMLRSKLSGDSPLKADAWFDVGSVASDFVSIIDLKHMELPLVSPYTVDTIGYKIRSGQFSTHIDASATDSKLDGNINLKLLRADLKPADKDTMESFNKELTMPLPTALSLLEDRDKEIELDMPLKGDINDPSFSAKGVMRFVMLKAIKEATVYYVKSALLPQNTVFSLVDMFGGMVYDKLTELPAMKYKKGQVELTSAHKSFLDNVGKMMAKKKKLRFRVCGLASPLDGDEANAITLTQQRTAAVRQYLVQEHKIATERLMQCLASYEEKLEQSEVKLVL